MKTYILYFHVFKLTREFNNLRDAFKYARQVEEEPFIGAQDESGRMYYA